jgi:hypothetical protein
MNKIINQYYNACNKIARSIDKKFDTLNAYWVWDRIGEIYSINDDMYLNMSDMATIVRLNISTDLVYQWDYHRTEHSDYYINLENFVQLYDWEGFSERYIAEVDKNRAYWNSPEWKAEEKRQFEEMTRNFIEKIWK